MMLGNEDFIISTFVVKTKRISESCQAGSYKPENTELCLPCEGNTISATDDANSCIPCEDGQVANVDRVNCTGTCVSHYIVWIFDP